MCIRLPAEYQEVEWITAKNCDVDLSYVPKVAPVIKFTINLMSNIDADIAGFLNNTSPSFIIDPVPALARFYNRYGSTGGVTYGQDYAPKVNVIQSWEFGRIVKLNGSVIYTNQEVNWSENTQSMHLFCARNKHPNITLYNCSFYDGEQCVRKLVPCYRKSDNKPGMYDLVSGEFFVNQGTGEFTVGPDVIDHMSPWLMARRRDMMKRWSKLPAKYQEVEYLESVGDAYIVTGIDCPKEIIAYEALAFLENKDQYG